MFANTLTLTIDGVGYVLNRLNQDSFGSEYQYSGAARAIVMKIRHSVDTPDKDGVIMKRHNVFVEQVIYPTPSDAMKKETFTATLRGGKFENPDLTADLAVGVIAWLSASSSAAINDLSVGVN